MLVMMMFKKIKRKKNQMMIKKLKNRNDTYDMLKLPLYKEE